MLLLCVENGCAGGERAIILIGRHRPVVGGERCDLVDDHVHHGAVKLARYFRESERIMFVALEDIGA